MSPDVRDGQAYIAHVVGCAREVVREHGHRLAVAKLRRAVEKLESWERLPEGGDANCNRVPAGQQSPAPSTDSSSREGAASAANTKTGVQGDRSGRRAPPVALADALRTIADRLDQIGDRVRDLMHGEPVRLLPNNIAYEAERLRALAAEAEREALEKRGPQ